MKFALTLLLLIAPSLVLAQSLSYEQAKIELKRHVYFDMNKGKNGDTYCGCDWEWTGRSGGRVDHSSCGYKVRAQPARAARIEYEHVFAAHSFGHQRQCWQNGGRSNCVKTDPTFNVMYTDLFNLIISVGEVNADRANYRFSPISAPANQYGACQFKVDFKSRIAEPPNSAKGKMARISFYMADRYNLNLSSQQERAFMAWDKQYPVTAHEKLIHDRKAKLMGHSNPFVTGTKSWTIGYKPDARERVSTNSGSGTTGTIRGNANSKIYHLRSCPSYDRVSERNRVPFTTESEAVNAGYRKAGNC